ncbi:MAG TPA: hypothetical protein VIH42_12995 [Thermoguttaceae bacterium]
MSNRKLNEKHFILRSNAVRDFICDTLEALTFDPVYEIIIRPFEKHRTHGQNDRYWATLTECLRQIKQTVYGLAESSGHTPLEIRRLIAADLLPEQIAILFAKTPETVHDVLKEICDVPTSTRLGTKEFQRFEERMEQTIAEIAGHVGAFRGRFE